MSLEKGIVMNIERHHPKEFLEWLKSKKAIIAYWDKVSMCQRLLNLSEIFGQMNSSQKIAVMKMSFTELLDEDEKSFFLSEINAPVSGKAVSETECNHKDEDVEPDDFEES